jgi:uncharacterized protein
MKWSDDPVNTPFCFGLNLAGFMQTSLRGPRIIGELRTSSTPQLRFFSACWEPHGRRCKGRVLCTAAGRLGRGYSPLDDNRQLPDVRVLISGIACMRHIHAAALFFAVMATSSCVSGDAGHWVEVGGERYKVEVADDDQERARGLMFRDSMPEDRGMLFVHERQEPLAYWMKNTKIPLDILYFDAQRRLVSQQRSVPPCTLGDGCPPYPSSAPARYVLELNAGQAAKLGLKNGAELRLGPAISTHP